ncbi:Hint domain-containing protein [Yoonia sp.]|uniref:Hint domain-containing protein n=1 Tax=Yoonia sp. TaxID=2212373 RepID=UPI00358F7F62
MAVLNSGLGGPEGFGTNVFSTATGRIGNLDDGSIEVDITSVFGATGIDYFGTNYTSLYINTNGLITFDGPETAYTPIAINTFGEPAIAPFWSDVDITNGGEIYWDVNPTSGAITITWSEVAPYNNSGASPPLNSFQVVLTNTGSGDFSIEFIYEDIEWTNGFTGQATVGFTDGGANDVVLPGSGDPAALTNFDTTDFGNGDPDGRWETDVTGGTITSSNFVVDGTAGDDIIDVSYDGDPENDFVDAADGTGVGRNDDVIDAGAGNDTIDGGLGDDTIFGRAGDDTITVGVGDTAEGGDDADSFVLDFGQPSSTGSTTINVDGGTNGVDDDSLDLSGLGRFTRTETTDADGDSTSGTAIFDSGQIVNFTEIENLTVCFAEGTQIKAEDGIIPIEKLCVGDRLATRDHGLQTIRWIGKRVLGPDALATHPNLQPIRIAAGALGAGRPSRDLVVSPQHRIVVRSKIAVRMFDAEEVFVPAKHLLGLNGVSIATDITTVIYYHLLCDDHEIIEADGALAETLYTGTEAMKAMTPEARKEIALIFGEHPWEDRPLALFCPKGKQAKRLVERHIKNDRAIYC